MRLEEPTTLAELVRSINEWQIKYPDPVIAVKMSGDTLVAVKESIGRYAPPPQSLLYPSTFLGLEIRIDEEIPFGEFREVRQSDAAESRTA